MFAFVGWIFIRHEIIWYHIINFQAHFLLQRNNFGANRLCYFSSSGVPEANLLSFGLSRLDFSSMSGVSNYAFFNYVKNKCFHVYCYSVKSACSQFSRGFNHWNIEYRVTTICKIRLGGPGQNFTRAINWNLVQVKIIF